MSTSTSARPAWQRGAVFRFFASLKLAVVLLAVLIIAAITGTIYESTFDAKVARTYIYGAPWFNLWLVLLAANLAVSALSRWPWKKHHTAFLVTHLGIIILLAGSLIGRIWGIEGTITLFKGQPPTNRLLVDEHQLRVRDVDGVVKGYVAEFGHRPPTPGSPRDLGLLASGARLSVIDYAPAIEGKLNPRPVNEGGAPALHFTIKTAMMGQTLENWLLADDPEHGSFSMGLATISFKRGRPSAPAKATPSPSPAAGEIELEESIFAFSRAPEEQVGRVTRGGGTGAKIRLLSPENGNKGRVTVSLGGKQHDFDVAANLGKDVPLPDSGFMMRIDSYWPDFRIEDGKPRSLTEQPNNPAVLLTVRGKGVPVASAPKENPHGKDPGFNTNGGPPAMPPAGGETPNKLTVFVSDDGALTYELVSRRGGTSVGKLELNAPLTTGWADWAFVADKTMSRAEQWMDFRPVSGSASPNDTNLPDGLRVRLEQGAQTFEQWVPAGWQINVPTSPQPTQVSYGWKIIPLPVALELLDFEVKRNEGSDSPAGFKSTVRVGTAEGEPVIGQCWMNHPFSFPGNWWNSWSGQTFKISQASWNPENLGQSTVQILRDPGWLFKWIGSLLLVSGVFMMFYLRPYRKQTAGEPITPDAAKKTAKPAQATERAAETVVG